MLAQPLAATSNPPTPPLSAVGSRVNSKEWGSQHTKEEMSESLLKEATKRFIQCEESFLERKDPMSTLQLAVMMNFAFVYAVINGNMALFLLPSEAERLNPGSQSLWVALYLGVCGVTQLIGPVAGKFSDRHQSKYGRRRPFIVGGVLVLLVGIVGLWMSSVRRYRWAFLLMLFISQTASNVIYSAQCALPVDLEARMNDSGNKLVSGIIAAHNFGGAVFGMAYIVATQHLPVWYQYPMFMIMLIVSCVGICYAADEEPTKGDFAGIPSFREIWQAYLLDMNEDRDFFLVCMSRMFFFISTSSSVFMFYYLRDMLHVEKQALRREYLGLMAVVAQTAGACCSVPFARLSDSWGIKRVIYLSGTLMCVAFCGYITAPQFSEVGELLMVLCSILIYGVGCGAYVSVDYAIAFDCMPKGKTTSEAFGLWGVAGFLGSTIGPGLGGSLLALNKSGPGSGSQPVVYSYLGYAAVMVIQGICMNFMVMATTAKIRATT